MKSLKLTGLATTGALALLLTFSCQKNDNVVTDQGLVWNTLYHVTYIGPEGLRDSIPLTCDRVASSVNIFDTTSLVGKLNRGVSVVGDSMLLAVYREAKRVNKLSGGQYDPTIGPILTAWGFGPGHTPSSDTARIDEMLKYCGFDLTELHGDTIVKLDRRTQFNFSSLAKGYGCDQIAEMFKRNGVENYLIEIGGEITMGGTNPDGGKWRVSIDKPTDNANDLRHKSQSIMELTDCGVATSGNYRNYHPNEQGMRFGHTIDAITGRPALTDIASVTIVAPTAMEADALATAVVAMGSEKAIEMLKKLHRPAYIVLNNGEVWMSEEMKPMINS